MTPGERDDYARRNVVWLTACFGAVAVVGLWTSNVMAAIAGALGLGWIARAFWRKPK